MHRHVLDRVPWIRLQQLLWKLRAGIELSLTALCP
jgi:hypothetical protein